MKCHIPWTNTYLFPKSAVACCMAADSGESPLAAQAVVWGDRWSYLAPPMNWWYHGEMMREIRRLMRSQGPQATCTELPRCAGESQLRDIRQQYHCQPAPVVYTNNVEEAAASYERGDLDVSHYPLSWYITLGEMCPNHCRHCYQRGHVDPEKLVMPMEAATWLRSYLPYARFWHLTGGEPLAMPDELLDLVLGDKERAPQAYVNVYTSLSAAHPRKFKEWAPRIDGLTISLDACSRARYENIKTGARFDRLLWNLKIARANNIWIDAQMVVMRSNLADIPHMAEFCRREGIRTITLSRLVNTALVAKGFDEEDIFQAGHDPEADRILYRNWVELLRQSRELRVVLHDQGIRNYLAHRGFPVNDRPRRSTEIGRVP